MSRQLSYFLAVAEHLHFGRASDHLDVAQSALSRHVKELERLMGVRLLNRGRRSAISLTEPGKALVREASAAVQQLNRAITASQQAERGEIGRISLGYVTSASLTGVLPRVLERYRVHHGGVTVQITAMDTPSQLAALHEGALDIGFLRPRRMYPAGIVAHIVHREDMLLALAANHPLTTTRRFDLKDLERETFIIPQFDENTGFAEQLAQLAAGGGFEPVNTLHVQDFLTAMTLAAGGYGIVPVPRCMLAINMRNLVFKPIHGYGGTAELVVAYNPRKVSQAAQAFIREATRRKTAGSMTK